MDLNPQQKAAIEHDQGPALIIAGAGTGKTRVITHRIAHLITTKRARPEEILALTFTDKAAHEMEERVDLLVPYGYTDVWISTFHAFGDRVLREHAFALGLPTDFRVLSRPEQVIFFRNHLFRFPLRQYRPLGNPTKFIEAILTLFSRAKDEDVSPEEYLAFAQDLERKAAKRLGLGLPPSQASGSAGDWLGHGGIGSGASRPPYSDHLGASEDLFLSIRTGPQIVKTASQPEDRAVQDRASQQMELAKTYQAYQALMAQEGCVDFGDQVNLALKLFREHPSVLKSYQDQFRYILVDEFQDTNYAQFQLVKLLAERHQNILVVADDDQSIYHFRGAAMSNILMFRQLYPNAIKIVLTENYRSGQKILDTAYRLIQFNNPERLEEKESISKRLVGREEGEREVRHLHFDTLSAEADAVADMIQKKVEAGEYRYRDFAILVRANNDADPYLRAMNMKEIPHRFTGNRGLYRRPEVRLLLAFLHAVADFHDSRYLYELARSELYRAPMRDLQDCTILAHRRNKSLYYVFTHVDTLFEPDLFSMEARATFKVLVEDLHRYLELSRTRSPGVLLYEFLKRSGLLNRLIQEETPSSDEQIQNIAKFFDQVRKIEDRSQLGDLPSFIQNLDLLMEAGDDPAVAEADPDVDAVRVLTVHKAKGLEFPVVFLVSLVEQKFPSRDRRDPIELPDELVKDQIPSGDIHLQEERRLFYVGMTRAMKELYLTSARDYGTERERKVSRFVLEALDLSPKAVQMAKTSPLEAIERHAPIPNLNDQVLPPVSPEEMIPLSYYQIDDYLTCPLKYKYRHVLRIPIYQHHAVVYGAALHQAVAEYYRRRKAGHPMDLSDLIKVFESEWKSEGFLSREHEEQRLAAGRTTLARFFEVEEKRKEVPTYIEKDFSFMLKNNRVLGRWDRIDVVDESVKIIDYKSSEVRDQKEANKKTKESLQLAIYAMAYQERFKRLPDEVELRFLESDIAGNAVFTEKDLEKTREKILEAAEGIRGRDYTARPTYLACQYCAYREICPKTAYGQSL
jgi:DNA helicase-2/ATP-dependent DNA helicase PcrA